MADGHQDTFHHVRDSRFFELPGFMGGNTDPLPTLHLPFGIDFDLTKFMVLQAVAGLLVLFIFTGLAIHIRGGRPARGRFWNFWEMLALAIRDQVVRPVIGIGHHHDEHEVPPHVDGHHPIEAKPGDSCHSHATLDHGAHPADKYLPYVWTCFFYILFCNLLGALPHLGSATGHLSVTLPLALTTLIVVIVSGSMELGIVKFWKSLAPTMDLPGPIAFFLVPLIWIIEFVGLLVKHCVLALRLFLNIMGGHTVIGVILSFIALAGASDFAVPALYWVITPASVLGQVGIGLLELFVAFLQAYVFAFLTTLFIASAVHPH
jgi:F-type H+-transporting ATPase subunit a